MADTKNDKNSNSPALRFPGFTEPWKKFALGDLGTSFIGLTYSPKDIVQEDGIIVLRSSNIQDGVLDFNDIVRVSKKIRPSLFTQEDDILICSRNGSARLIGKNAIIPKKFSGLTFGAFMMVYRSNQNRFIHHLLNTKRYQTQVAENLGARINQITSSDLNSFDFFFPCEKEQTKIAKFIDLINERIATQRRLIEDLEKLKSSIIDKTFSDVDGEVVKYSDILKVSNLRNDGKSNYIILSASQEFGMIERESLDIDIKAEAKSVKTYKRVLPGDYVLHLRSFQGGLAFAEVEGICSPAYTILRPNKRLEYGYLKEYFNSSKFIKSLVLVTYGIRDGRSINVEEFLDMNISIHNKDKQTEIVKSLSKLSDKLNVEASILNGYEQQRNYLLGKLFI